MNKFFDTGGLPHTCVTYCIHYRQPSHLSWNTWHFAVCMCTVGPNSCDAGEYCQCLQASGAYVFIKQVTSSFASEAISEASHEVGHLLCVLLLQPLLVHLGSPALIPGPVLLLAYQVLLQAHTCLMTAPRDGVHVCVGKITTMLMPTDMRFLHFPAPSDKF